jgi:arginyl-tRNA synthetase
MEQLDETLERRVRAVLASLGYSDARVEVRPAARPEFGDYSTPACLGVARATNQDAMALAGRVRDILIAEQVPGIGDVSVTKPGFVNFSVDAPHFGGTLLSTILEQGDAFGHDEDAPAGKVLIEHTNINSNKAAHIGHLRNACIGDSLARLLRATGRSVEVENYIDDTGVQVADVVVGFQVLEPVYDGSHPFDYFCSDVYTAINRRYKTDPSLLEQRKRVLFEIEEGHNETARFAKELSQKIVRRHLQTMARLGINYDLLTWESDILALGFWRHAFEQLKVKNLLQHPTEGPLAGCWVVPFEEGEPLDQAPATAEEADVGGPVRTADKVLVKSDGVATYTAKDIAYQLWKFGLLGLDFHYELADNQGDGKPLWTTYTPQNDAVAATTQIPSFGHADEVVNVIDVRQSYLQQIVKESLRRLGFAGESDRSIHLAYEVVALSAASARELGVSTNEDRHIYGLKGREGIEVKADDLISIVEAKVAQKTIDAETAAALAAGAVRFYMLKFNLNQIIVFDANEAAKTTGDTGVYLQYSYARSCSILRRVGDPPRDVEPTMAALRRVAPDTSGKVGYTPEMELLLKLAEYPRVLRVAAIKRTPASVAQYALQLATAFTNLIEHTPPIIREEDPLVRNARLSLVAATRQVMANTLGVLGIPAREAI